MFKKPETWKDWSLLLSAWATGLVLYGKAAWGFDLTPYVDVNFIMLTLFMFWTLYGVWKNTFVSPKGKKQKQALIQEGLYRPNK
ncbi:hypothetical protein [Fictibacillus sp. JL2B1089]|uniref:hypothetical protein n=1 Tax=Fictibacillus sp. JL2B1089 TaxID=3399565 RepID=UPI003A8BFDA9